MLAPHGLPDLSPPGFLVDGLPHGLPDPSPPGFLVDGLPDLSPPGFLVDGLPHGLPDPSPPGFLIDISKRSNAAMVIVWAAQWPALIILFLLLEKLYNGKGV